MHEARITLFWWAIGVVAACLLLLVSQFGIKDFLTERGAAWVQAVMSVAAIVCGFMLAMWQQARASMEARAGGLEAVIAIAEAAEHVAKDCTSSVAPEGIESCRRDFDYEVGDRVCEALRAVPLHQLGSREAVQAVLQIGADFSDLIGVMQSNDYSEEDSLMLQRSSASISRNVRVLQGRLEQIRNAC